MQEFIPSSRSYPAGKVQPEDEYCKENTKKIKRVPGMAPNSKRS
jgi:hypothetical protein